MLALLSTWLTATTIIAVPSRRRYDEDVGNLYEQVLGAVKSGDLPRGILFLEGEDFPMARILSAILTESTKFTPKLRVAYKITLESLRRRSQVEMTPLKIVTVLAPLLGLLGMIVPVAALIGGSAPPWKMAFLLLVLGIIVGGASQICLSFATRQYLESLDSASEYGKKMLNFLLSADSPLSELRMSRFPD